MNCDRIAPWYRWLEYASFGRLLERCRFEFLPRVSSCRAVLMIGEGDGRFLAAFARANPNAAHIDYLDSSRRMGELARARTLSAAPVREGVRLRVIHQDARTLVPDRRYDLLVTHFFLDCLTTPEIDRLLHCLLPALQPGSQWLVSEFRIPPSGSMRRLAAALIRFLYGFFGWTTGLGIRSLPDHRSVFLLRGFHLVAERTRLAGLLVSELWQLHPPGVTKNTAFTG